MPKSTAREATAGRRRTNEKKISLAVPVSASLAPRAQASDHARPLKEISTVFVLADLDDDKGASKIGLTKDAVPTEVEPGLPSTGLPVISREEFLKIHETLPEIYFNVSALADAAAACVDVSLLQDARLLRNGQASPLVGRCNTCFVAAHPTATLLCNGIKDPVDPFLNRWLEQNPRR